MTRRPWDYQAKTDTPKSFDAFTAYLNLGVQRTLPDTAKRIGKSLSMIREWSAKADWINRAGEYDSWIQSKVLEIASKEAIAKQKEDIELFRQAARKISRDKIRQIDGLNQIVNSKLFYDDGKVKSPISEADKDYISWAVLTIQRVNPLEAFEVWARAAQIDQIQALLSRTLPQENVD